MTELDPRAVISIRVGSRGTGVPSTEPLDAEGVALFAAIGEDVVNLFCDHLHDGEYVAVLGWRRSTGELSVMGGQNQGVPEGDPLVHRTRYKFECSRCGWEVNVREENLARVVGVLVEHGVTEVTLSGLAGILGER